MIVLYINSVIPVTDRNRPHMVKLLPVCRKGKLMEQNFNLYHIFIPSPNAATFPARRASSYISQPAISKAISKLEQSLGTTLFYRSSRGVSLTEPGEILFVQVENAFQAITQGEEQLQRFQKLGMGHLSIGVSATLCKYVLLPILQPFIRQNPHIQLSIACQSSSKRCRHSNKERSTSG